MLRKLCYLSDNFYSLVHIQIYSAGIYRVPRPLRRMNHLTDLILRFESCTSDECRNTKAHVSGVRRHSLWERHCYAKKVFHVYGTKMSQVDRQVRKKRGSTHQDLEMSGSWKRFLSSGMGLNCSWRCSAFWSAQGPSPSFANESYSAVNSIYARLRLRLVWSLFISFRWGYSFWNG